MENPNKRNYEQLEDSHVSDTLVNRKKQKCVHFDSSVPVLDTVVNPEYVIPRKNPRIPIKNDSKSIANRHLENNRSSRNACDKAKELMIELYLLNRQDGTSTRPAEIPAEIPAETPAEIPAEIPAETPSGIPGDSVVNQNCIIS
jgi:hypothetical protein